MPDANDETIRQGRPAVGIPRQQVMALLQSGRYEEAVAMLRKISVAAPNNAEVHRLLGRTLARTNRHDEAIESLQRSLQIGPDIAQTHSALGFVLFGLGRADEAAACFNNAVQIDDSLVGVQIALAEIDILRENFPAAEKRLKNILEADSTQSNAHFTLARLEKERGNHLLALNHTNKALELEPDSIKALCNRACELMNLARNEEAEESYKRALKIDPESLDAISGLAQMYEYTGKYQQAVDLLVPLVPMNRHHTGLAIVMGRICKQVNKCEEAVDYIEACLEEPSIPRSTRKTLHFTAGKILDHLGRYEEAFAHYRAGNDLVTHLYDAVGNAQLVNNLIKTFTPGFFMGKPRASISDKQPIFIVGMPRSGTSLTEQILASHPQVYGAGELLTMTNIIEQFRHLLGCTKPFPACIDRLQQDHVDKMATQYIDHITRISGSAEFVTDKFPHNFYALGLIQLLFPNAKIIHCRRDPMDTGLSIYFQDFLDEHDYAKDLFNIGMHYHQYQRLMQHWRQVLLLPMLEIDYEEMVSNQETATSRLLAFCGLDWDDACLQFHKLERHMTTASYEQVRQPIYTKSIERWKHYEKHLRPLREGLERGY